MDANGEGRDANLGDEPNDDEVHDNGTQSLPWGRQRQAQEVRMDRKGVRRND